MTQNKRIAKLKCILFGHKYDVKSDDKTIFCSRENKVLDLAKKGYAWELASILSNRRWRLLLNLLILVVIILGAGVMMGRGI